MIGGCRASLAGSVGVVGVILLLLGSGAIAFGAPGASATRVALTGRPPSLPAFNITFAANSTAEVEELIADHGYIGPGDSFDLVSGNPQRSDPINVSSINAWATMLRATYPGAAIYAHTAGLANYALLAEGATTTISGLFYDYEPGYETEFTTNFTRTLANFENATKIAHAHGFESIAYPTGKGLADYPGYSEWDYAEVAAEVDGEVIQSQRYCEFGTASFAANVSAGLREFVASEGIRLPTFQITIGPRTNGTGWAVRPAAAYDCARVLAEDDQHTLYLWWNPSANADVLEFLQDIGRRPAI